MLSSLLNIFLIETHYLIKCSNSYDSWSHCQVGMNVCFIFIKIKHWSIVVNIPDLYLEHCKTAQTWSVSSNNWHIKVWSNFPVKATNAPNLSTVRVNLEEISRQLGCLLKKCLIISFSLKPAEWNQNLWLDFFKCQQKDSPFDIEYNM